MSQYTVRKCVDFVIQVGFFYAMFYAGAGWWALLIVPFALWNFYDGMTRCDLLR